VEGFSGTFEPFNSVRGAACMMLQTLSKTRESGSLTLLGEVQRRSRNARIKP